jgi:putative flippase GtrA
MTAPGFLRTRRGLGRLRGAFRNHQALRFLIVGSFNTALCFLVYMGFIWAGLPIWAANFCALMFGIGLSFLTQGRVVFGNRDPRRFVRFAGSWFIISATQTAVIELLVHRGGMGPSLAGLIVLPGAAIVSFLVQKWFVFHKRKSAT